MNHSRCWRCCHKPWRSRPATTGAIQLLPPDRGAIPAACPAACPAVHPAARPAARPAAAVSSMSDAACARQWCLWPAAVPVWQPSQPLLARWTQRGRPADRRCTLLVFWAAAALASRRLRAGTGLRAAGGLSPPDSCGAGCGGQPRAAGCCVALCSSGLLVRTETRQGSRGQ